MRIFCSFLVLFSLNFNSYSQNVYFSNTNYSDSAALAKNIPALAKQIIRLYKEPDKITYYDVLFRLQLVAKDYIASQKTLDTISPLLSSSQDPDKAIGFHYRTYSHAMEAYIHSNGKFSFDEGYKKSFIHLYKSLPEKFQTRAESYFNVDLQSTRKDLDATISELRKVGKDSILMTKAIQLIRRYNAWLMFNSSGKMGKQLIAGFENEKYIFNDSVLIKLPDGGSVSLTIVRKREITNPQPVVMKYSIYPDYDHNYAKEIANRGYAGIVANTRGKRLSNDGVEPFEHDAKDAYHIMDWISKQPWCNGKIGMYGGSYLGFAQWSSVKRLHPALKTIVPQVSVGAGVDYPVHNGVFMSYMLRWIHYVTNNKLTDYSDFSNVAKWDSLFVNWYKSGRSFRALDTLDGKPNKIFQRWLDHPSYDKFWQSMTPQKEEYAKLNIPILTTTGYYDDDQLGAMHYYKQHHKYNPSANHYLLIGPYDHYGAQGSPSPNVLGYNIDSVANISIKDVVFNWFDYILKDGSHPNILKDKVNFQIMGKNEWKHVGSLKQMSNDSLSLFLSNIRTGNYYKLLLSKPKQIGYIEQNVNLKDRTDINYQGKDLSFFTSLIDTALSPPTHQLVFVTDPLPEDILISGGLKASIAAAINKKDVDIMLKLYEQMPDGKYFGLTQNLQRASYSHDRLRRLLKSGKIETIELSNAFITSRQLHKGSRIVIIVGVNKNADWQINYGTGKDVSNETIKDANEPLNIKWYNSSIIKIPVWR